MSDIKGNGIRTIASALAKFAYENFGNGRTISLTPEQANMVSFALRWEFLLEVYSEFPSGGGCWSIVSGLSKENAAEFAKNIVVSSDGKALRIKDHSGEVVTVIGVENLPKCVDPYTE